MKNPPSCQDREQHPTGRKTEIDNRWWGMYIGNIYLQNITRTTFYHSDNSSGGGGGGDKRLKKSNRLQVRKNQIGSAF